MFKEERARGENTEMDDAAQIEVQKAIDAAAKEARGLETRKEDPPLETDVDTDFSPLNRRKSRPGLENLGDRGFERSVNSPEEAERMRGLLLVRQHDLTEAYKRKGYKKSELNALNDAGKLDNFRSVQRAMKELNEFLRDASSKELEADTLDTWHAKWLAFFVQYQELIEDINALPKKESDAAPRKAGEQPEEEGAPQPEAEKTAYEEAREVWKQARDEWKQTKEAYARALQQDENRSAWQRFRGIGKMPEGEFAALETKYKEARRSYAEALSNSASIVRERRGHEVAHDENKAMFYRKYVVKEAESIVQIQTEALSPEKRSIFSRATAAFARQPQWQRYLLSASMGAAFALGTGGSSLVGYAARFAVGTIAGKGAAEMAHGFVHDRETKKVNAQQRVVERSRRHHPLFDLGGGMDVQEARHRQEAKRLVDATKQRDRRAKIAGTAAAVAAGGLVAGTVDFDPSVGVDGPSAPESAPQPQETAAQNVRAETEVQPLPDTAPIPESRAEALANYVVVREGDTLWDIMEERYAGILNSLPAHEQTIFLDQMKDYLAGSQELRDAVGLERSDINHIEPGEQFNMAPLDSLAEAFSEQHETTSAASPIEAVPHVEALPDVYTVERGDNLWNILEHRYQDHLETLPSEQAKDAFIDRMLDTLDASQELKDRLGLQRPDINVIKPGETLNLAIFDEMLPQTDRAVPDSAPVLETRPDTQLEPVDPAPEVQPDATDVGNIRVSEILQLWHGVDANDPGALAQLEALGLDRDSLQGVVNWIFEHGNSDTVNESLTLNEYMQQYADEPYGTGGEPMVDTREASYSPETESIPAEPSAAEVAAHRDQIVRGVEEAKGFFGRSTAGTFEHLAQVKMRDIEAVLQDDSRLDAWLKERNISEEGFEKWMDWVEKEGEQHARVDRNMTFGQYVDTVVKASAPKTVSV